MVCTAEVKVDAVTATGEAAQATEPTMVPPSFICTVLPTAHVILKVGVSSEVILSVLEEPVSEAICKSGVPGAAGAVVSIVTDSAALVELVFPAGSTCLAVIE